MKLLFDQNLSFKLWQRLATLFPGSSQVRLVRLAQAADRVIWDYAGHNGFVLVSLDVDFADRARYSVRRQRLSGFAAATSRLSGLRKCCGSRRDN
jgi:predicted nuclease of predicted toxin-antitoxin system